MLWKHLSPVSILVGVVFSVVALVVLWPVDDYATAVLLLAFGLGAGGWEIIRRIRKPKPADGSSGLAADQTGEQP